MRIKPLPPDTHPDLASTFETYKSYLGYPPNSVLIMQHRPKVVRALAQMASAVWDKESEVDLGLKRLVAYMVSRTHGCSYSMAHAAEAAHRVGLDDAKLEAVVITGRARFSRRRSALHSTTPSRRRHSQTP